MCGRLLTYFAVFVALVATSLAYEEFTVEPYEKKLVEPIEDAEQTIVTCTFEYETICEKSCLVADIFVDDERAYPEEGSFSIILDKDPVYIKNKKDVALDCGKEVVDDEPSGDEPSGDEPSGDGE